jgi:hypothetical protein
MTSDLNDWIYIYRITKDGHLIYDRTVSRYGLGPKRAKDRVIEIEKRGEEGFYTIGTLTKEPALS